MTKHTLRDRLAFQRAQEEFEMTSPGERESFQRYLERAYFYLDTNPPPELMQDE